MQTQLNHVTTIVTKMVSDHSTSNNETQATLAMLMAQISALTKQRDGPLREAEHQIRSQQDEDITLLNANATSLMYEPDIKEEQQQLQIIRRPNKQVQGSKELQRRVRAVNIQLTSTVGQCKSNCLCSCHQTRRVQTASFARNVLGQLFLGYSGLPGLTAGCDYAACASSQSPQVAAEYWFPIGVLWSKILQIQISYQANLGPQLSLQTMRRVPDNALCVNYASSGNIEALVKLFQKGLASPRDVSDTRGYSLLRVCHHLFLKVLFPLCL